MQQAADAYRAGELARAETLAEKVCEADASNEQAVLILSGLLLHRKATAEAEILLRRARSAGLDSAPAGANLALCLSRQGKHAEASELARTVTEAQPSLVSAWNTLGAALLALNEPAEAEDQILRGLAVHPEQPALTLLLGHARRAQQRDEEAEESYRQFDRSGRQLVEQAELLTLSGRYVEAEHQFRQLVATQPRNPSAHAGLGRLLLRQDKPQEALFSLQRAQELDPSDGTIRHFLGVAEERPSDQANSDYVRALFDEYAGEFDSSLVDTLGYRIPEEMARCLLDNNADLSEVLDLGCGTGLMARALAGHYQAMDGVDLSGKMLDLARRDGRYRELIQADVVTFAQSRPSAYTSVLAADVLVYVGELNRLLAPLARAIRPGGVFAFSIELNDGAAWSLNPQTGRYQHHPNAVDRLLENHGFASADWTMTTIRQELSQRIPGAIGLARRE